MVKTMALQYINKEKFFEDILTLIENVYTLEEFVIVFFNKDRRAALSLISKWGIDQEDLWTTFIQKEFDIMPNNEKEA